MKSSGAVGLVGALLLFSCGGTDGTSDVVADVGACVPEARECSGKDVVKCNAEGTEWVFFKSCDEGCSGGECTTEEPCVPDCAGKTCGDDGCGWVCGSCAGGTTCQNGECVEEQCIAGCGDRECGLDDCGNLCGSCDVGETCVDGYCESPECTKDCTGLECGPDPLCGYSCGTCFDGEECEGGSCEEVACTGPGCPVPFVWDDRWQGFWKVDTEEGPLPGGLWLLGVSAWNGNVHLGALALRLAGEPPDADGALGFETTWQRLHTSEPWYEPGNQPGKVNVTAKFNGTLEEFSADGQVPPDLRMKGTVTFEFAPEPVVTCEMLEIEECPPCSDAGAYPCESATTTVAFDGIKLHPVAPPYLLHREYEVKKKACLPFDEFLVAATMLRDSAGQHYVFRGTELMPVNWDPETFSFSGSVCTPSPMGAKENVVTFEQGFLGGDTGQIERRQVSTDVCADADPEDALSSALYAGKTASVFGAYSVIQATVFTGTDWFKNWHAVDDPIFGLPVIDDDGLVNGWGLLESKRLGMWCQPTLESNILDVDVPPSYGVIGNFDDPGTPPNINFESNCSEVAQTAFCTAQSLNVHIAKTTYEFMFGTHRATCTQACFMNDPGVGINKVCDDEVVDVHDWSAVNQAGGSRLDMANLIP